MHSHERDREGERRGIKIPGEAPIVYVHLRKENPSLSSLLYLSLTMRHNKKRNCVMNCDSTESSDHLQGLKMWQRIGRAVPAGESITAQRWLELQKKWCWNAVGREESGSWWEWRDCWTWEAGENDATVRDEKVGGCGEFGHVAYMSLNHPCWEIIIGIIRDFHW